MYIFDKIRTYIWLFHFVGTKFNIDTKQIAFLLFYMYLVLLIHKWVDSVLAYSVFNIITILLVTLHFPCNVNWREVIFTSDIYFLSFRKHKKVWQQCQGNFYRWKSLYLLQKLTVINIKLIIEIWSFIGL